VAIVGSLVLNAMGVDRGKDATAEEDYGGH
jgi:hypothetical protein